MTEDLVGNVNISCQYLAVFIPIFHISIFRLIWSNFTTVLQMSKNWILSEIAGFDASVVDVGTGRR